jgi:hypothetical protein
MQFVGGVLQNSVQSVHTHIMYPTYYIVANSKTLSSHVYLELLNAKLVDCYWLNSKLIVCMHAPFTHPKEILQ